LNRGGYSKARNDEREKQQYSGGITQHVNPPA
jgi:hypothetical protein